MRSAKGKQKSPATAEGLPIREIILPGCLCLALSSPISSPSPSASRGSYHAAPLPHSLLIPLPLCLLSRVTRLCSPAPVPKVLAPLPSPRNPFVYGTPNISLPSFPLPRGFPPPQPRYATARSNAVGGPCGVGLAPTAPAGKSRDLFRPSLTCFLGRARDTSQFDRPKCTPRISSQARP